MGPRLEKLIAKFSEKSENWEERNQVATRVFIVLIRLTSEFSRKVGYLILRIDLTRNDFQMSQFKQYALHKHAPLIHKNLNLCKRSLKINAIKLMLSIWINLRIIIINN